MKSDGPYKFVKQSMWDYPTISGPGIKGDKKIIGAKEWLEIVNLAYAASRKAESERCLAILAIIDRWRPMPSETWDYVTDQIAKGGQDGK